MANEPNESDVAELVEQIETGPWDVLDYEYAGGRYERFSVNIELEWSPATRGQIQTIFSLIEDLETEYESGVPVEDVFDEGGQNGIEAQDVADAIDILQREGDVYEPNEDRLRVV